MGLHMDYNVEPFRDAGMGNTPPILKFDADRQDLPGAAGRHRHEMTATVGVALGLDHVGERRWHRRAAARSAAPRRAARHAAVWHKHRGRGEVKFAEDRPKVDRGRRARPPRRPRSRRLASTSCAPRPTTLSGEGGGGFQCCWTTAHVKVTVK